MYVANFVFTYCGYRLPLENVRPFLKHYFRKANFLKVQKKYGPARGTFLEKTDK